MFLDSEILPDNKLVNIALDDAYFLGVLSSRIHVAWAITAGGWLGVGNDPVYSKSTCFDPFPFPDPTADQKQHIRDLGEQLDAHRKRQQAEHPDLTITEMYNVLEKLRSGESLTEKEKKIHEKGLVTILKQIHDELDTAVFAAYGWPTSLTDEEILERLVVLNAERAREEKAGNIRWLRPEFQAAKGSPGIEPQIEGLTSQPKVPKKGAKAPKSSSTAKVPWPSTLKEQAQAVRTALAGFESAATADELATGFKGAQKKRVAELLETLAELGQVREVEEGRFAM